jgi:quercetin dioxygenase-like cupin family protein
MAQASARADPHRHIRMRVGAERGSPKRGDSAGRCGLVPAREKHWHGATSTTAMAHIAILEHLNGKTVDWMEKVSDEEYRG